MSGNMRRLLCCWLTLALAACWLSLDAHGFTSSTSQRPRAVAVWSDHRSSPFLMKKASSRRNRHLQGPNPYHGTTGSFLLASMDSENDNDSEVPDGRRTKRSIFGSVLHQLKQLPRRARTALFRVPRLATVAFAVGLLVASGVVHPPPARASAPVMAMPKAEDRDPIQDALREHERQVNIQTQKELDDLAKQARAIEAEQGGAARVKFEKECKQKQQQEAEERKVGLVQLKRKLLDQGLDPFTDMEGQRKVILYEKGIDLGEVQGTPFNLEKEWEQKSPKRSMAVKKKANRQVIACMVQDMKNRDIDPLKYFEKHPDKSMAIMDLPQAQAQALAQQYTENLEKYGQITVPKEGEVPAIEKMKEKAKTASKDPAVIKAAKAEAKRLKAEIRAKEKAEKQRLKEEAKAAKQKAKEEAKAAAKAAAEAAALDKAASIIPDKPEAEVDLEVIDLDSDEGEPLESAVDLTEQEKRLKEEERSELMPSKKSPIRILPTATFLVAAGGGGYAFKLYREKAARDEEERQRQFRLLMGEAEEESASSSSTNATLEATDVDVSAVDKPKVEDSTAKSEPAPAAEAEKPAPKKKRRLGLNVFAKKKSGRETDLDVLVSSPDAKSPDFAKLLAKTLTFGAPGRFPNVVALPGDMPMQEFDLDSAKQQLIDARQSENLSVDDSAEIFANVVNCMLIDIVDLGSAALKEKDEKVTVDAINIVVDFMNHAASLYDAVAEDASIKPVVYEGTLSKSKLENMYSTYASSGMMDLENMPDNFDDRVALLKDVFEISDKKAEGLMMKAMQKNLMKMMKSGEGMEGMQEMMKGMDGDMPFNGDDASLDPEQLKTMLTSLKEMKDSGTIPPEELAQVRSQFREQFGSSIEEVMKDASNDEDSMSGDEKEMLELMKSILDD